MRPADPNGIAAHGPEVVTVDGEKGRPGRMAASSARLPPGGNMSTHRPKPRIGPVGCTMALPRIATASAQGAGPAMVQTGPLWNTTSAGAAAAGMLLPWSARVRRQQVQRQGRHGSGRARPQHGPAIETRLRSRILGNGAPNRTRFTRKPRKNSILSSKIVFIVSDILLSFLSD